MAAAHLLGFKTSFNHSFCCRFCYCSRENFKNTFSEESVALRTQSSSLGNVLEASSLEAGQDCLGLISSSDLKFFHDLNFYEIFPPCIDHDIFEGILPKIVKFSLAYFISKRYCSFSSFNTSILNFKLSGKDKHNFPLLNFDSLSKIRFTASEGYTFSRFYLLFLTGVPNEDPILDLVKLIIKIILICMSFSFSDCRLVVLDNLIESFLSLCSNYSEGLPFTVKFHHLIHYPRMITKFGPPRIFSTINFESLHSKLKSKIKNSCNWKSVCYTISTKYARSKLFTEMSCPIEIGKTPCVTRLPFNIPTQSLSNSYSLRGLKIYNQQFYCNKNAVIYKHSIDSVEFLAITDITKVNNDYILSGDLHSSFSDSCSKYFLVPNQNHGYIVLSSLNSKFSYEIYSENSNLFIVPYFDLDVF